MWELNADRQLYIYMQIHSKMRDTRCCMGGTGSADHAILKHEFASAANEFPSPRQFIDIRGRRRKGFGYTEIPYLGVGRQHDGNMCLERLAMLCDE